MSERQTPTLTGVARRHRPIGNEPVLGIEGGRHVLVERGVAAPVIAEAVADLPVALRVKLRVKVTSALPVLAWLMRVSSGKPLGPLLP